MAGLAQIDWNVNDATRIGLLDALERVKNAACGAQALACALDDATRRRDAEAEISSIRRGRGVAGKSGGAQRIPPPGQVHLGLAKNLRAELPNTLAGLQDGTLSEWRATLIARETAHLSPTDRGNIDAALCKDPKTLHGWGNRRIVAEAKKLAYQLDPTRSWNQCRAHSERRISCRPAPDSMAYLTALVPMTQGVAALAARKKAAVSILSQDAATPQRSSTRSKPTSSSNVSRRNPRRRRPLTVNLVLSDRALPTNCDDEPPPRRLRPHPARNRPPDHHHQHHTPRSSDPDRRGGATSDKQAPTYTCDGDTPSLSATSVPLQGIRQSPSLLLLTSSDHTRRRCSDRMRSDRC